MARRPVQPDPDPGRRSGLLHRREPGVRRWPRQPYLLAARFILAGLGIGCGETAQSAAVAALAPASLRGSVFGLLATAQSGANLAASAVAAILWTAVSTAAAFLFLTAAMTVSVPLILTARQSRSTQASTSGRETDPA